MTAPAQPTASGTLPLPFARPRDWLTEHSLSVDVEPPRRALYYTAGFVGQRDVSPDVEAQLVHVISPHRGGEIRGYVLIEHRLHLRTPCYSGEWPEMDMAVGDLLGALVVPYRADSGGTVRPC
jgi:hypothetical protein